MRSEKSRLWALTLIFVCAPRAVWAAAPGGGEGIGLVSGIGLAVIAASVLAVVFNRLKIPALLGYIVAGLILGAFAKALFGESLHTMEEVSHLGLVFLLFIIGLEMDIGGIFRLGAPAALAVLLQAPIAFVAIYALQLGLDAFGLWLPGLGADSDAWIFYAVACALGSTAVVVKLLGDKFDLGSQAGRVTVLTLIAEDIFAVIALSFVQAQGREVIEESSRLGGLQTLAVGIAITAGLVLFARYAMNRVMSSLATSPDLIALVALGWCFVCVQAISKVGLSAEMGALIAGLTLGSLPQRTEVLAKVSSLRDFFIALFFVALGMALPPPSLEIMAQAAALVGIVIVARLLLYAPTLFLAGLGPIVSFTVPINLAQLSEFALLIVPVGISSGALSREDASVISYALMLSVIVSTFAIAHNYRIAILLERVLPRGRRASPSIPDRSHDAGAHESAEIVVLGFFQNTEALALEIGKRAPELLDRMLVVDFNLKNHRKIAAHGLRVTYGDISNPETLRHFGLHDTKVVLSTIGNAFLRGTSNEQLLAQVRSINPEIKFIATAASREIAEQFRSAGAFATICPPAEAAPAYLVALEAALDHSALPAEDDSDGANEASSLAPQSHP